MLEQMLEKYIIENR